jgi:hypothetical protein
MVESFVTPVVGLGFRQRDRLIRDGPPQVATIRPDGGAILQEGAVHRQDGLCVHVLGRKRPYKENRVPVFADGRGIGRQRAPCIDGLARPLPGLPAAGDQKRRQERDENSSPDFQTRVKVH